MGSRFKGFGAFGSKRSTSQSNNASPGNTNNARTGQHANVSETTLSQVPSPLPPPPRPPVLDTAPSPQGSVSSASGGAPSGGVGRPPSYSYNAHAPRGGPAPAGTGISSAPYAQPPSYGVPAAPQYPRSADGVGADRGARSKAQLIVGIDFVSALFQALLTTLIRGYHFFRRGVCVCHQYRGQGRYHLRVAWCWQSISTKGGSSPYVRAKLSPDPDGIVL